MLHNGVGYGQCHISGLCKSRSDGKSTLVSIQTRRSTLVSIQTRTRTQLCNIMSHTAKMGNIGIYSISALVAKMQIKYRRRSRRLGVMDDLIYTQLSHPNDLNANNKRHIVGWYERPATDCCRCPGSATHVKRSGGCVSVWGIIGCMSASVPMRAHVQQMPKWRFEMTANKMRFAQLTASPQ